MVPWGWTQTSEIWALYNQIQSTCKLMRLWIVACATDLGSLQVWGHSRQRTSSRSSTEERWSPHERNYNLTTEMPLVQCNLKRLVDSPQCYGLLPLCEKVQNCLHQVNTSFPGNGVPSSCNVHNCACERCTELGWHCTVTYLWSNKLASHYGMIKLINLLLQTSHTTFTIIEGWVRHYNACCYT